MGLGAIFGGGPSLNLTGPNTYMATLNNLATNYGSQAANVTQNYNTNNAQNQAALNAYSQYLTSNPATNQYNAQLTANAEKNASEGNTAARANLEQNLAQRGISTNSGIGAGALSSLATGEANNNANVQAQIGEQEQAQHNTNLGTNAALWSNAANNSFSQANALNGAQTDIYGNLLNTANQDALAQYQAQVQQGSGFDQLLGTLGAAAFKASA